VENLLPNIFKDAVGFMLTAYQQVSLW